jgi:hypothetical protein
MKKKPGKQISIRINPDLIAWVDNEAEKENRSRNKFIETLILERKREAKTK